MLFSIFGEISLTIIGLLYVCNLWFDSMMTLEQQLKEDKNNEEDVKMSDVAKRMYS